MRTLLLSIPVLVATLHAAEPQWEVHDMNRPQPPVVADAKPNFEEPPAEAIVLFDGQNLDTWTQEDGSPAKWKIVEGAMEVMPDAGSIQTRESFGSCRLHIEWCAPSPRPGDGQHGGNSGAFLMKTYEIQVLDSFENPTYADGMAAAVYGQKPPASNPTRPNGEWNSYDITFHRPVFAENGSVTSPARVTVVFNGETVQDDYELTGQTLHKQRAFYSKHADKLPLLLQDHGDKVRFRNIWIVPIDD